VHRGVAPEDDEHRVVLFWLSYDSKVLGERMRPNVDGDQITKLTLTYKVLKDDKEIALHDLTLYENKFADFFSFLFSFLTFFSDPIHFIEIYAKASIICCTTQFLRSVRFAFLFKKNYYYYILIQRLYSSTKNLRLLIQKLTWKRF